ncbi:MAG: hypothetical protein AB1798_16685 [Spirochaetota bacterium]
MEDVIFCSFCGKVLRAAFYYCPYCGSTCKDIPVFERVIDNSLKEMEKVNFSQGLLRLEQMETMLAKLEKDLNFFLSIRSS